jgi:hypothetical protein
VRGSAVGLVLAAVVAVAVSGCGAPRGFVAPTGAGTPDTSLAEVYQRAVAPCADLRSITADVALSGRVDGRRVRGTLQIGLTRDGGVRIEAVAPFGAPIFTIAGRADEGTLWLPRTREVVRAGPAEILQALTGVTLPPEGLFEILTACPGTSDAVVKAERFASPSLARITLRGGAEVWLRPDARPVQPVAVRREGAIAEYRAFAPASSRPLAVRLRDTPAGGAPRADLTLTLKQVETNVALGPEAFTLAVPDGARGLTLSELRQAGVLR